MVRRRRRRSPHRALGSFKDGFSSVAMESLESRCMFNMGPVFSPPIVVEPASGPRPVATVADVHDDHPIANVEMLGGDRQSSPLDSAGYFSGEFSSEPLFVEHEVGFAPPLFSQVIIVEIQPSGWSDSEASQGEEQPASTSPAATLQPSININITGNAGDANSSRPTSQDVGSASASAVAPVFGYSNVLMNFDFDAPYVRPSFDVTLEAVRSARPDANDPGKLAPAGLALRPTSTPTITSETEHHANELYLQLSAANYAGAPILGKQPAEATARLEGDELLRMPMTQGGEPEPMQRVFEGAFTGFRKLVVDRPEAAVAIRPAMSLAAEVQGRLLEVSSEFFDSEISWASVAPLLPQFSPEAAQLGQAFDAVLADLDELGGELISSLADSDRLLWGAGACGVISYVAARHLHLRAAPPSPGMRRSRETAQSAPRRVRLSVQPLLR